MLSSRKDRAIRGCPNVRTLHKRDDLGRDPRALQHGAVEVDYGRWWLVPFFAKEMPKAAMFNARIETVDTSGAFREPFNSKRCLIPAVGYFEWTTSAEDGKKDPSLLQMPEGKGFSFAAFGRITTSLE